MIENKRIFLTGGAGFIGTKLCQVLSENNEMLLYDNMNRNSIKFTNLLKLDNVKLVEGDILDYSFLKLTIDEFKPDIVIHLAAIAGIDTVIKNPVATMKINIIGTYNILEALKSHSDKLERFVDFSTSEVFGCHAYNVDENSSTNFEPVGEARWTYSVSKLAGEHFSFSYFKEYGLPTVTIRPFNIYGPGQVGEGAIHHFIRKAIKGEAIEIHGTGEQIRSWCYIEDFVDGILLCLENDLAIGKTFNIGNPRGTITIYMLAELIKTLSKSTSPIKFIPKDYVDVDLRIPNIEKAKNDLGFCPKFELNEGLYKTINWYREVYND